MDKLNQLLSYYEEIIDVNHHKRVVEDHKKVLRFEPVEDICIRVNYPSPEFKPYSIEEIHQDMGKMMFNELLNCYSGIESRDYTIPMLRANYGVGTLASCFGLKSRIIDGNMPWVEHVSTHELRKIVLKGIPDFGAGFDKKIIETYEFYEETLSKYPKCKEVIKLFHPDFQGPLDVAHLMYGSDIYMDMYDDPEFVHELINLVTDTYIDRMKRLKPCLNDETEEFCFHWMMLFPGKIVLRNDSAVNISTDMYQEFVRPYDNKIMEDIGKSTMHFCGRADHWFFDMARSEKIAACNFGHMSKYIFGQEYLDFISPELKAMKKPVVLYVLTRDDIANFDFTRYATGVTYTIDVKNKEEAKEVLERCKN